MANPNDIKVFALGGLCEVGKNMYCIEQDNEIIIIDSGIGFPEGDFGINVVLPDYTYLKLNEEKIVGLFITHGHEDHIGGIPFLLKQVNISKIYANAFSIKLISSKLKDFSFDEKIFDIIEEYNNDSVYTFNNFTVSFFRTNHSIPDSHGVAIKTRLGYILHTGDFKFDLTPVSNDFDYYKVSTYNKAGILLLMSDSTNATINKQSVSEKKVSASLRNQFSHIKGRIIISTFASNTVRIGQIIEAAANCDRKIVIFGKSIEKSINVATSLKYLNPPKGVFIKPDEFQYIEDDKIVVLSTGTQGEPLSALTRIANGTHRYIKIKKGDTVIFSSSSIPGNQDRINSIIDTLFRSGADVITNSSLADVHSSGHAYANELQLMLNLCKPRYFMPIHGEYAMLYRHAELANEVGIKKNFVLQNGDILLFSDKGARKYGKVPFGNVYVDERNDIIDYKTMKERMWLSENGIICLVITLEGNKLYSFPTIVSRGFVYNKTSHSLITKILEEASRIVTEYLENNDCDTENIKQVLEKQMPAYILKTTGRSPLVTSIILKK